MTHFKKKCGMLSLRCETNKMYFSNIFFAYWANRVLCQKYCPDGSFFVSFEYCVGHAMGTRRQ